MIFCWLSTSLNAFNLRFPCNGHLCWSKVSAGMRMARESSRVPHSCLKEDGANNENTRHGSDTAHKDSEKEKQTVLYIFNYFYVRLSLESADLRWEDTVAEAHSAAWSRSCTPVEMTRSVPGKTVLLLGMALCWHSTVKDSWQSQSFARGCKIPSTLSVQSLKTIGAGCSSWLAQMRRLIL